MSTAWHPSSVSQRQPRMGHGMGAEPKGWQTIRSVSSESCDLEFA